MINVFVLIGDSPDGLAEEISPRVASAIATWVAGVEEEVPVISMTRENWPALGGDEEGVGGAVIWFGLPHGNPDDLAAHLRSQGLKHITVWSQSGGIAGLRGVPPTVTSW